MSRWFAVIGAFAWLAVIAGCAALSDSYDQKRCEATGSRSLRCAYWSPSGIGPERQRELL